MGEKFKFVGKGNAYPTRDELKEQWRSLVDELPYLRFPETAEVRVIPPFAGAACRFQIRLRKSKTPANSISVYLDAQDALGFMGKPYWEIYPYKEDTRRFILGEEKDMVNTIMRELRRWEKR